MNQIRDHTDQLQHLKLRMEADLTNMRNQVNETHQQWVKLQNDNLRIQQQIDDLQKSYQVRCLTFTFGKRSLDYSGTEMFAFCALDQPFSGFLDASRFKLAARANIWYGLSVSSWHVWGTTYYFRIGRCIRGSSLIMSAECLCPSRDMTWNREENAPRSGCMGTK
jgi:hypothetical protein